MTFFEQLLSEPWAIDPRYAENYIGVANRIISGDRRKLSEEEKRPEEDRLAVRFLDKEGEILRSSDGYPVTDYAALSDGNYVALVNMLGPMFKRGGAFMEMSGACSMERVGAELRRAGADPKIKSILLNIDSPGGTVSGTSEFGDIVREVEAIKPIVGFINERACSAAYWAGANCTELVANGKTAEIGSIGVVLKHTNAAKKYEADGLEITYLTSSKADKKVQAPDNREISPEEKAELTKELDYLHDLFEKSVIKGRRGKLQTKGTGVFNGSVFLAEEALKLGLIDRIGNFKVAAQRSRRLNSLTKKSLSNMDTEEKTSFLDEIKATIKAAFAGNEKKAEGDDPGAGTMTLAEVEANILPTVKAEIEAKETANEKLVSDLAASEIAKAEAERKLSEAERTRDEYAAKIKEITGKGPGSEAKADDPPALDEEAKGSAEMNFLGGLKKLSGGAVAH